jgi:uncharacterized membrane protein
MSEAGPVLLAHLLAGLAAITAGFVALFARKGEALHRKSGTVFVTAMVVMASAGAGMAAMKFHIGFQKLNTVAGLFTVYLVVTALLTVRRRSAPGTMDTAAMVFALLVGLFSIWIGLDALNRPKASWFPTVPAFVFGTVALFSAFGDFRMIRAGGLKGAPRIVRHLWRMCFALFIAAGSFFLGQAKVFPEALRIFPLLATPVVLVLLAMVYWWIRMRVWPPRWTLPTLSGER